MFRRPMDCNSARERSRTDVCNLMRFALAWLSCLGAACLAHAEKPPIDARSYSRWPMIQCCASLSPDGKYLFYSIGQSKEPDSSGEELSQMLQSNDGRWSITLRDAAKDGWDHAFSPDSKSFLYVASEDRLGIVSLQTGAVTYLPNVAGFKLAKMGSSSWLVYQRAAPQSEVVVRDLATKREQTFVAVKDYVLSDDGK